MPIAYELPWNGQPLSWSAESPIALDTETEMVADLRRTNPRIVLATASDGTRHVVLRPEQLGQFYYAHEGAHFVLHNAAFDFWVLQGYYAAVIKTSNCPMQCMSAADASCGLWQAVEENRLHDTMLLDQLLRLATGEGETGDEGKLFRKSLADLAGRYLGKVMAKKSGESDGPCLECRHTKAEHTRKKVASCTLKGCKCRKYKAEVDPYRERFNTLWDVPDWRLADPGFFDYAVDDVVATHALYPVMRRLALQHADRHQVPQAARDRWGLLTEGIQVKAAIALLKISRNGLLMDKPKALEYEAQVRKEFEEFVPFLQQQHPELLQYWKKKNNGAVKMTDKSGVPRLNHKELVKVLAQIAKDLGIDTPLSTGKKGGISKSAKLWAGLAQQNEFLQRWTSAILLVKRLGFFDLFKGEGDRLHPEYNVIKRTGRVSAEKPNTTQMPKLPKFRALFIPTPGHKMMTADYAAIELRTLASICEARFGKSVLADVLRSGKDAHCYTYSAAFGEDYESFTAAVKAEKKLARENPNAPTPCGDKRQKCKAVAFGIPGGLGADKLVVYAKTQYRVDLTRDEAQLLRDKIRTQVYPEWDRYLAGDELTALATNLHLSRDKVSACVSCYGRNEGLLLYCLGQVLRGQPTRKDGSKYDPGFQSRLWDLARGLAKMSPGFDPDVYEQLTSRTGTPELYFYFFAAAAVTPTGRIRSKVRYTELCNTPFQGLAADGGKLALWELINRGKRVVAFIHDEILTELPLATAQQEAKEVEAIMNAAMESVLGTVSSAVEYHLGDCWNK